MSEKARSFFKDVLLVAGVFTVLSGAYVGFAYAERYRALTGAYIAQSEKLMSILSQQSK
ncbi:hypothetical protein LCGC14_2523730 [marine sediment metagenome]|uniref:Uncharacterized protein n=1 Tax=marine sediment metagenome TaxID=412755 RepID=A0A0F9BII0_9ZZZZ